MHNNPQMIRPPYEKEILDCDNIFNNILRTIKRQPGYVVDIPLLTKAYTTAKKLHGDVRRHSGVLYLRHPLAVMETLSRLMCKTSVLAAALLHDTMEDCKLTYESIRKDFSYEIAEIVSAVTAIKSEEKANDQYFASMTADEKHAFLDQLTDAKLISTAYQREAFLVRFADREHNLSTIDACKPGKRMEKIASTRAFLIPAAKKLGMRYFEIVLNDYCLKFEGEDYTKNASVWLLENRNALTRVSGRAYSRFDQALQDALETQDMFAFPKFNPFAKLRGVKREGEDEMQTAQRRVLLAYELQQQLQPGSNFERSHLDLWEVILTCRSSSPVEMLERFISLYQEHLKREGMFFRHLGHDQDAVFLRLTDRYENNYRIVLIPESKLETYFIGDPNGDRLTMIDEEAPGDALRPQITVYSYSPRKGYKKFSKCVPFGATALDFAFIISPALAYTVKTARIHTWKGDPATPLFSEDDYRYPLRTILNDGDVVYFDADYFPKATGQEPSGVDSGNVSIPHATIDWFADINTEYAKKCLIRYFKDKYSG